MLYGVQGGFHLSLNHRWKEVEKCRCYGSTSICYPFLKKVERERFKGNTHALRKPRVKNTAPIISKVRVPHRRHQTHTGMRSLLARPSDTPLFYFQALPCSEKCCVCVLYIWARKCWEIRLHSAVTSRVRYALGPIYLSHGFVRVPVVRVLLCPCHDRILHESSVSVDPCPFHAHIW